MDKRIKKDLVVIAIMLGFIVFAVVKWEIPYFNLLGTSSVSNSEEAKVNNENTQSQTEKSNEDSAIIDGVEYKVNRYNISKHSDTAIETGNTIYAQIEDGNIIDEHSFVNIDVTIKNMNKDSVTIDVNTLTLNGIETMKTAVKYKVKPVFLKNSDITLNNQTFELEQGQSVDITFIYILEDKMAEDKLLSSGAVRFQFIVNPQNVKILDTFSEDNERNGIYFIYNLKDIAHK